jgi:hypothetical protein
MRAKAGSCRFSILDSKFEIRNSKFEIFVFGNEGNRKDRRIIENFQFSIIESRIPNLEFRISNPDLRISNSEL